MKVLTALGGALLVCCAGTAMGTDSLDVQVLSGGSATIAATPGETIDIEIVGELSDAANEGLALFGVDMTVTGDVTVTLYSAATITAPADTSMDTFVSPEGLNNPTNCANCFGFGGTADGPAHDGDDLLQIGGGQNTIGNETHAPYPVGDVVLGLAQLGSPQVLAVGTLTLPASPPTYTITVELANGFANVIKQGETGTGDPPVFATEAVGSVIGTGLTINVSGGVPPQIVSVASIKNHDAAGDLALDVTAPASIVEPRLGGIEKLEVVYDMAMQDPPGAVEIDPYGGNVNATLSGDGLTLTVTMDPPLASPACYEVDVTGVVSAAGAQPPADPLFNVIALEGDIDRGGVVTTSDASIIKPLFGQTANAGNAEFDFDASGLITTSDFSQVKPLFGNAASCP